MTEDTTRRTDALARGLASLGRRAWDDAYDGLAAAHRTAPLDPPDAERLGQVAHLVGRDAESAEHLEHAHQAFLRAGDVEGAARCAFWLGFRLQFLGERARGSGWIARARRLLDDAGLDSVLRGYLLLPGAIGRVFAGDTEHAYAAFQRAVDVGERFGDAGLVVLARHGQGRTLIRQGRIGDGIALLDEVMVSVTADDLAPDVVGVVYCGVLDACFEICDLRRAQEWTAVLHDWCASQPGLVAHRGQCLLRRAEIMQWHGAWPDALDEATRACDRLVGPPGQAAAGAAFYQCGELHRLRGDFARAEAAYEAASRWGHVPQPGLALLRLAQGDVDGAATAVDRAIDEARTVQARARALFACVDVRLAAHQLPAARAAADALSALAATLAAAPVDAPLLHALAAHAEGAVRLAEDGPLAALAALHDALARWRELDAPYEAARVDALLARAHAAFGDPDAARAAREAARGAFHRLGAVTDLARLTETAEPRGPLTPRELEVLRRLATGRTNRAIAADLAISEKTVARHVANIFTKLALTSRAAATAYAFRHGLA